MPKQKIEVADEARSDEALKPFSVIIDGHDRTVFATDEADLQDRIAKLRV